MWQHDRYSNNSPLYRTESDDLKVEMKNSRAIAVLWGVFSVCFCIIDCVVFFQPHWLGDTKDSPGKFHIVTEARPSELPTEPRCELNEASADKSAFDVFCGVQISFSA